MGRDVRGSVHPRCRYQQPKIHGVLEVGEAPPTEGRCVRRRGKWGYTYTEESEVGAYLQGYMGVIELWSPRRICVFDVYVVNTDQESYDWRHPCKILSQKERRKKGKYIETHVTPIFLCGWVNGEG